MTNIYFSTTERIKTLEQAAAGWRGTPFVPNAAIKGHGVSCQKLVGHILMDTGFLPAEFDLPAEPMNWSQAHTDSLLEAFMARHADCFALVNLPAYQHALPGDVLGIRYGGCVHHCGLVLSNGSFVHCLRDRGVLISHLSEPVYMRLVKKIWRPLQGA